MMLPAEICLEVYKYIDPRHNLPSKYAGLRATCRQLGTEFDHEALKAIRRQYARRLPKLRCNTKIHPERPIVIADVSIINVRIPLRKYHPGTYTCAPRPGCFSWPWLKTLIVTFDLQKLSNDASPYYDPSFDTQAIILSQYTWRLRRSKRGKWMIQHLASFLLLLETWCMKIKHAWPFISRFIRSVIVYTCFIFVLLSFLGAVLYGAALAFQMLVRAIVRYGAALTVQMLGRTIVRGSLLHRDVLCILIAIPY
jgi:hypothetical protein